MEVRLVDVTALRGNQCGTFARGKAMGRVIEADQRSASLRGDAELGAESRPQALPAPFHFGGQLLDPDLPAGAHDLPPNEGDFRVDTAAGFVSSTELRLCNGETLFPRCGGAQLLLELESIASSDVFERSHRPADVGRCTEHCVREHRRQSQLQTLDISTAHVHALGRDADDDAAALLLAAGVVDEHAISQVDVQRHRGVRNCVKVDAVAESIAEARHTEPGQPDRS
jgi:hypothetical protein